MASVEAGKRVTCSRGVVLVADASIADAAAAAPYDAIALPGGMPGAARLGECKALMDLVAEQHSAGRVVAAICAAPAVALPPALLAGRKATAHPAFADKLPTASAVEARVVVDGALITSRGPGTAFEFALALVAALFGPDAVPAVAGPMVLGDATTAPVVVGE